MHDVVHRLYFLCFSLQCDINLKIKPKRRRYSKFFCHLEMFLKRAHFLISSYYFIVQFLWCCYPAIHALLLCTNIPTLLISHLRKYKIVKISQFQLAKCKCMCGGESCWTAVIWINSACVALHTESLLVIYDQLFIKKPGMFSVSSTLYMERTGLRNHTDSTLMPLDELSKLLRVCFHKYIQPLFSLFVSHLSYKYTVWVWNTNQASIW